MATATLEQVQTTLQMVELAKITPSPMNPRKRFDDKSLKELAESIKAHGVQQPIVVRPFGNKKNQFEIVVGERRFRASKIAGLTEIPAIVRPLSNAAALEIMVIENLQREDVHPLDEALGYEALMKKSSDTEAGDLPGAPRHTAESIAAKVGKSVGYVYARLKLLALVPAAREAFEQNLITPGHSVLIARLQPKDQLHALNACFDSYVTRDTTKRLNELDPHAAKLADVNDAFAEDQSEWADEGWGIHPRLLPEKGLREWIQDNVNLSLKSVPWDLTDDQLVPWAGPCSMCPKRSVSNPFLFQGLTRVNEHDTCFDPECFKEKQKAFVKRTAKEERADGKLVQISEQTAYTKPKEGEKILKQGHWIEAKVGSCESVQKALIVRGENAGQHKNVCTDLNCKVHKRHLSSSAPAHIDDPKKRAEAEAKQKAEEERNRKFKKLLLEKVGAKLTVRSVLQLFAAEFFDRYGSYELKEFMSFRGFKGDPGKALKEQVASLPIEKAAALLGQAVLWNDVQDDYEELGRYLPEVAQNLKIDIKKLSAEFNKAQTPAEPEKPAKPVAKKGKKAKKAKAK